MCLGRVTIGARITSEVPPVPTMLEEEAQSGELSALGCAEKRRNAVYVGYIVFGSSFQQHVTDLHIVSTDSFLQCSPTQNAVCVHCCAMV